MWDGPPRQRGHERGDERGREGTLSEERQERHDTPALPIETLVTQSLHMGIARGCKSTIGQTRVAEWGGLSLLHKPAKKSLSPPPPPAALPPPSPEADPSTFFLSLLPL